MPKPFLLFYCIVLLFQGTCTTDYCKMCKNQSHTMCKYKSGPAESCTKYTSVKMTPKIQSTIIDLHNELRNKVASGSEARGKLGSQPSATNMLLLKWNDELSRIAQRWADQCVPTKEENHHDECKDTEQLQVGQNVIQAIRGKKTLSFENMVKEMILNWYNEVDRLDSEEVNKFQGADEPTEEFGHYAQLVWATTQYVGCAHASFTENITKNDQTVAATIDTLICNYGPTGNVVDASIYKVGEPCSECTCSEQYSALCNQDEGKFTIENTPNLEATSEIIYQERSLVEQDNAEHFHLHSQTHPKSTLFHVEPQALVYTDNKDNASVPKAFIGSLKSSENLESVTDPKLDLGKQDLNSQQSIVIDSKLNERSYFYLPQKLFELFDTFTEPNLSSNNQLIEDLNNLYDKYLKNNKTITKKSTLTEYDEIEFRALDESQNSTNSKKKNNTVKAKGKENANIKSVTEKQVMTNTDLTKDVPVATSILQELSSEDTPTLGNTKVANEKTTAGIELACSPHSEHHEHHHPKGGKCPFESYGIQYRYLHREGDECYCLFRITDATIKVSGKSYVMYCSCLVLYYFYF